MVKENNKEGTITEENFDTSYVSMINEANKVLDTLSRVWKYCLSTLLVSLSIVGVVSIALYLADPAREQFFVEGIVFLAVAAWIFARNILGNVNSCCTVDISSWKSVLRSFIKPDNSLIAQKDGQSIIENLMKVVLATGEWIRTIKRDVFSVLFWPILAIAIFLLSVYRINAIEVKIIEVAFVIYMFTLTAAIYYGVNRKFQKWQTKVNKFKAFTISATENL